jgi:Xaa-Pro aminopeptidase
MPYGTRRTLANEAAKKTGADALLVMHLPDVRYLTAFTGSNAAVTLYKGKATLFTDGRYTTQAREETQGVKIDIDKGSAAARAVAYLLKQGATNCAFDSGHTTVTELEAMRKALPGKLRRSFFLSADGLVARIREIKDSSEIAAMRKAAALGCRLFESVLEHIVPGASEIEVAAQLELGARRGGADGMSFETIAASGARSALPHGRATRAKRPRRGFLTLDFGVILNGYCSDMTRTVHLGKPTRQEWDVYHSVLEAQQAAVAAVRPGVPCGNVDEAARSVLRKAKLEKAFSHSTGHGVGLEIHEGPRIAAKQQQVLEPGMIITIEPGAYLPGKFGVRIEDMVLVTGKGHKVLTASSPTAWMEL